jgi:hypothetical protein
MPKNKYLQKKQCKQEKQRQKYYDSGQAGGPK